MVECAKCKHKNKANAKFCAECGAKIKINNNSNKSNSKFWIILSIVLFLLILIFGIFLINQNSKLNKIEQYQKEQDRKIQEETTIRTCENKFNNIYGSCEEFIESYRKQGIYISGGTELKCDSHCQCSCGGLSQDLSEY